MSYIVCASCSTHASVVKPPLSVTPPHIRRLEFQLRACLFACSSLSSFVGRVGRKGMPLHRAQVCAALIHVYKDLRHTPQLSNACPRAKGPSRAAPARAAPAAPAAPASVGIQRGDSHSILNSPRVPLKCRSQTFHSTWPNRRRKSQRGLP